MSLSPWLSSIFFASSGCHPLRLSSRDSLRQEPAVSHVKIASSLVRPTIVKAAVMMYVYVDIHSRHVDTPQERKSYSMPYLLTILATVVLLLFTSSVSSARAESMHRWNVPHQPDTEERQSILRRPAHTTESTHDHLKHTPPRGCPVSMEC